MFQTHFKCKLLSEFVSVFNEMWIPNGGGILRMYKYTITIQIGWMLPESLLCSRLIGFLNCSGANICRPLKVCQGERRIPRYLRSLSGLPFKTNCEWGWTEFLFRENTMVLHLVGFNVSFLWFSQPLMRSTFICRWWMSSNRFTGLCRRAPPKLSMVNSNNPRSRHNQSKIPGANVLRQHGGITVYALTAVCT